MKLILLPPCLQCYLPEIFLEVDFICRCYFITDMIVCRVWYELFEKQIRYYTLCCVGSLLQYRFFLAFDFQYR